ncbi:MAG TPA: tail fiber protein [Terracidiphilus sp.]|nr:tail fiber protein [Terracidiphilus sp.]
MSQPYVGEVRIFAGNFAPAGWMFCEGQLLPISEYETLFNLIGTTYGGDGQNTFALPDMRGRVPMHQGNGFTLAETGGVETVTLTVSQIPVHSHPFLANAGTANTISTPANSILSDGQNMYTQLAPTANMAAGMISSTGGSQPHDNFQPYLCLDWIISLFGVFPSQT